MQIQTNKPKAITLPARYMTTPTKVPKMLVTKIGVTPRSTTASVVNRQSQAKILTGTPPPFKPIPKNTLAPKMISQPVALTPKQTIPRPVVFDASLNKFSNSPSFEIQKSHSFELTPAMINQEQSIINAPQLPLSPVYISPVNSLDRPKNTNFKRNTIPQFQSMPDSVSRISTDGIEEPKITRGFQPDPMPIPASTKLPVVDLMGHTVEELAAVANVSVEVLQAAINMRQKELLAQQQALAYQQIMATHATSTTTTTTTTAAPTTRATPRPPIGGGNKV